jgi:hypothetical protein
MLSNIRQRMVIVHANNDIVVIPINAFLLERHLPDAQFLMYPGASQPSHSQYAELFLEYARLILNGRAQTSIRKERLPPALSERLGAMRRAGRVSERIAYCRSMEPPREMSRSRSRVSHPSTRTVRLPLGQARNASSMIVSVAVDLHR